MRKPRIFCVGLNKTATTSLHEAFKILGFKSCHNVHNGKRARLLIEKALKNNRDLLHYFDEYDVYSDMGLFSYFKELDKSYPDSKFILNTRDANDWVESRIRHDEGLNKSQPFEFKRPVDRNQRKKLLEFREKIHNDILDHFMGRNDFLIIDVCKGEGWEKLCPFLGVPIPKKPFPYLNKTPNLKMKIIRKIPILNRIEKCSRLK
jgi:hypothetical protein